MASSFADKVLKATAMKEKASKSVSPTRRPSASGSTSRKGSTSSSSPKTAAKGYVANRTSSARTSNLPGFVFTTSKPFGSGPADPTQSTGRRETRRNSGGELEFIPGPPYAVREGSRLLESPYGRELSHERTPRRRSSFAASLQNLSVASPSRDPEDVPGISLSPLVDDGKNSRSENQDPGGSNSELPQSVKPQERGAQQLGESGNIDEDTLNRLTASFPQPSVGDAFASVLPGNVSFMTNPLYPTISSPGSPPSPPPSAPHIDGFNTPAVGINLPNAPTGMSPISMEEEIIPAESTVDFLQKRKAAAAAQRQKGIGASDPNSAANEAILKRRTQVLSTVQKAKSRLSVLTTEVIRKRRSFNNNCFGRFRRWLYERERKRMMGKGVVVNRLWRASLKEMEVSYGSPIMVAFAFIRWVFLLNGFLAILWLCVIIIPFMAHPPETFSWKLFWTTLGDRKAVKETFQGSNLEKTFVYYGGYTYTRSEQHGRYRVDYMYAVMIAATFLFSFICVLTRISRTIMSSGDIAVAARLYPYSSLVFASWDFHLINADAASKLRRSIRMQLKEMLADVIHIEKSSSLRNRLMTAKVVFCSKLMA